MIRVILLAALVLTGCAVRRAATEPHAHPQIIGYGWYSLDQRELNYRVLWTEAVAAPGYAERSITAIYATPDGREVEVTEVTLGPRYTGGFNDAVSRGPMTEWLRSGEIVGVQP